MTIWDPDRYLAFADERGRPLLDLLARIGADAPAQVVDLGCGPGNLTRLLKDRWPHARVRGVDASPEMVARADAVEGIEAERADLRDWVAEGAETGERVDVLVSNATLQWVPGHLDLLPALVDRVSPGGWLAFQVPGNFDESSHTIRRELAEEEPYRPHTRDLETLASHEPDVYLDALARQGCAVDAWETTYLHVLAGADPVFTWVTGTGARPTLTALERVGLREPFEAEFRRRLATAYPDRGYGVVLPFRRIFVVAQRP